jgi:ABC-type lipoprotein release transport system permease subunit
MPMGTMTLKLAARNLLRNTWRSGLTAGGIAVAVGLLIWTNAFMEGYMAEMIEGATAVELGQVQVHRSDYADQQALYKSFEPTPDMMESVRSIDGLEAVAPRVEFFGLAGTERKSQTTRILGVEVGAEKDVSLLDDAIEKGRWLEPSEQGREVVLGQSLARQIGVDVGDELVVIAQAQDGSLGNDLLDVVGIVKTQNNMIDRQTAIVPLQEAQFLGALGREVHELAIRTKQPDQAQAVADAVRTRLADRRIEAIGDDGEPKKVGFAVQPWQDLVPEMNQMIQMSRSSIWIYYIIIYFIAALGILNTQRMSALERRREFGVIQAIGMSPGRLFGVVMLETVLLSMFGALLGVLAGGGLSIYHAAYGFDMGIFASHDTFSMLGVGMSAHVYFIVTLEGVLQPVLALLPVAILCGLWPALTSANLDPASAIAGRQ